MGQNQYRKMIEAATQHKCSTLRRQLSFLWERAFFRSRIACNKGLRCVSHSAPSAMSLRADAAQIDWNSGKGDM